MMNEWVKLEFWDYSINIKGQIRNDKTGTILKPSLYSSGYPRVSLKIKGCVLTRAKFVHRLVAETFIPNPLNKQIVNHIDANRGNFNIENLEWVTQSENVLHAYKIGSYKNVASKVGIKKNKRPNPMWRDGW